MGIPTVPEPAKLIIGILAADGDWLERGLELLAQDFGIPEAQMPPTRFEHTRYYAEELGVTPLRTFVSYHDLIARERLPDLKLRTQNLEREMSEAGKRRVNFDPGYLTLGQLFLASTKDQRQRVYVRDGIFVEPTLYFRAGEFHPFEWTYPDYREGTYFDFLKNARRILLRQLREDAPGLPDDGED